MAEIEIGKNGGEVRDGAASTRTAQAQRRIERRGEAFAAERDARIKANAEELAAERERIELRSQETDRLIAQMREGAEKTQPDVSAKASVAAKASFAAEANGTEKTSFAKRAERSTTEAKAARLKEEKLGRRDFDLSITVSTVPPAALYGNGRFEPTTGFERGAERAAQTGFEMESRTLTDTVKADAGFYARTEQSEELDVAEARDARRTGFVAVPTPVINARPTEKTCTVSQKPPFSEDAALYGEYPEAGLNGEPYADDNYAPVPTETEPYGEYREAGLNGEPYADYDCAPVPTEAEPYGEYPEAGLNGEPYDDYNYAPVSTETVSYDEYHEPTLTGEPYADYAVDPLSTEAVHYSEYPAADATEAPRYDEFQTEADYAAALEREIGDSENTNNVNIDLHNSLGDDYGMSGGLDASPTLDCEAFGYGEHALLDEQGAPLLGEHLEADGAYSADDASIAEYEAYLATRRSASARSYRAEFTESADELASPYADGAYADDLHPDNESDILTLDVNAGARYEDGDYAERSGFDLPATKSERRAAAREKLRLAREAEREERRIAKMGAGRGRAVQSAAIAEIRNLVDGSVAAVRARIEGQIAECEAERDLAENSFSVSEAEKKRLVKRLTAEAARLRRTKKKALKYERRDAERHYSAMLVTPTSLSLPSRRKRERAESTYTRLDALLKEKTRINERLAKLYAGDAAALGDEKTGKRVRDIRRRTAKRVKRRYKRDMRILEKRIPLDIKEKLVASVNKLIEAEARLGALEYQLKRQKPRGALRRDIKSEMRDARVTIKYAYSDYKHFLKKARRYVDRQDNYKHQLAWLALALLLVALGAVAYLVFRTEINAFFGA